MIEAIKIQMCIDQSSLPEFLATLFCTVPLDVLFGALVALIVIGFLFLSAVGAIIQASEKSRAKETPSQRWAKRG